MLGLDHTHAGDTLILFEMSAHVSIWKSCQAIVSASSVLGGGESCEG